MAGTSNDVPIDAGEPHAADCDSEAARLLPWHLTDRLGASDVARVTQHLAQCATCRADLEAQRTVRQQLRDDGPVEYAPQAGLAATLARIDELGRELDPAPGSAVAASPVAAGDSAAHRGTRWHAPQWLAAAVVVQAVGLGLLGWLLLGRGPSQPPVAAYETLSTPAAAAPGGALRAVFSADLTLGQLGDLLGARGLQVVSGPTEAGVYTLGFRHAQGTGVTPEAVGATLRALRADARVRFAEATAGTQVGP